MVLLGEWERRAVDDVLQQVEREGGDPKDKMRRAGMLTFAEDLTPLALAIRAWARRDPAVAQRLRKVDNARMDYLRSLLESAGVEAHDIEAVALLAFSVVIANRLIKADHPGQSRDEVLIRARRLLFG